MRFLTGENATSKNYIEIIVFMHEEINRNYQQKEKMKKLAVIGLIVLLISLSMALFNNYFALITGSIISISTIYFSFKHWQKHRMYLNFSLYSSDLLKNEYIQLMKPESCIKEEDLVNPL
jgi:hypothetical protein